MKVIGVNKHLPPLGITDGKTVWYWPGHLAEWVSFFHQTHGLPPDITLEAIKDKLCE